MEKEDDSSFIRDVLGVIRIISFVCTLIGLGSMICGILALIFTDPIWDFPYSTASGIWTGAFCLLQGIFGLILTSKYDINKKSSSYIWIGSVRGFAQASTITGSQHLGYSISAVVMCSLRTTRDNGIEKCNADEHDNLLIVHSFGIVFGTLIFCLGLGSIFYLLRSGRAAAVTGNPNFGKGGCCNSKC